MRTQENNRQACRNTSNVWRLNALAAAMAVAMGGFSAGAFAAAPVANSHSLVTPQPQPILMPPLCHVAQHLTPYKPLVQQVRSL
jgi:hypothetical protein